MKIVIALFIVMVLVASWPLERFQPSPHRAYYTALVRENLEASAHRWLQEAQRSLHNPLDISLPYSERRLMDDERLHAVTFELERRADQLIRVEVFPTANTRAEIFVDIFYIEEGADPQRVASMAADMRKLTVSIPADGRYRVRVQPSHTAMGVVDLVITSPLRYGFPVDTADTRTVQSFFGAARDGGARRHEGIDIFAARGTAVIAAEDGRVTRVGDTPRGGKNVWVQGDGRSFYYAHLDSIAVTSGEKITRGQVLGTVGNTGNAVTTRAHLHFGIYKRFGGAVDPLPLVGRMKSPASYLPPEVELAPHWLSVNAERLNLRKGPSQNHAAIATLNNNDLIRVDAVTGDWLRITTGSGQSGYVLRRLTDVPVASAQQATAAYLIAARPQKDAPVIGEVQADKPLQTLGQFGEFTWVKMPGGVYGWASLADAPE